MLKKVVKDMARDETQNLIEEKRIKRFCSLFSRMPPRFKAKINMNQYKLMCLDVSFQAL